MIAVLPWSGLFQSLLNGIGWVLARLYDVVPNFGVSIIILTVLIRLVLLPLGIKQIKSMQAMQAIQPRIKELQRKYKGNKQKAQEETMKLYREHGVNPLGGCLPLLLQFPLLIAMYAVIRPPQLVALNEQNQAVHATANQQLSAYQGSVAKYEIHNNHLPIDSKLFRNVIQHEHLDFLWMNLQCSAAQAGTEATIVDTNRKAVSSGRPLVDSAFHPLAARTTSRGTENCGGSVGIKVPYFLFLALMVATTFYQQRQMQQATPAGAASQQQQTLLRVMPIFFGVLGYAFPAGLVVYWTTANLWQIGQQLVLLKAGHIGPDALERRRQELANRQSDPKKRGFLASMMDRAAEERRRRESDGGSARKPTTGRPRPSGGRSGQRRPAPGQRKKKPGGPSGSSNGKGRPKR